MRSRRMPEQVRLGTGRSSSFPWKNPSAYEREKKTKTPSNASNSLQSILHDFLEARENLIQKDLVQDSGFLTTRRYADLMDRFVRSLFLEAGFKEKAGEILDERITLVALGS